MARTFFLLILVVTLPALAQTSQSDTITVVQLTIHPAAEPQPALKYQLLPPILEQTPGNAAPLYATAIQLSSELSRKKNYLKDLLETPADQLPPLETLEKQFGTMRNAELAARREKCDWDRPISEGMNMLLPEVGPMHNIGMYMALLARCQITKGNLGTALYTLQTGFSMARHTADNSCWLTNMVGIKMGNKLIRPIEEFIQAPGAPNLYWALTCLPYPFIDMTRSLQQEAVMIYRAFPFLAQLESKPLSPQEYQALIHEMARSIEGWTTKKATDSPSKTLITEIELGIKNDYPDAKRYLLAHGKSPKMVEAMPISQAVLIYHLRTFEQTRDDIYKWAYVPFWQGRQGILKAEKQSIDLEKQMKRNIFLRFLALSYRPYLTATNLDRQIAALRCIEALRMYAANHNNKLPNSLSDITEVPLPIDPVTGGSFIYSTKENKATLEVPAPPGEKADMGKRYEITLKSNP